MGDEMRITVIATGFEQPAPASQTRRREPGRQPVESEYDAGSLFRERVSGRQEPRHRPATTGAQEPSEAGATATGASVPTADQPEPFPVRSFDKEDLDIPAFLRRR